MKVFRETCAIFEKLKKSELVYKGQTSSKNIPKAYANLGINGRKIKGGKSASPTTPKKGCAVKRKKKIQSL